MINPWAVQDTFGLIKTIEQIEPEAQWLQSTMFPNQMPCATTSYVAIEYLKQHRRLAPFVVKGGHGVNVSRERTQVKIYACPMLAPRRVIGLNDIEMRQFGETPAFSTLTPEDRAAQMLARDLVDLRRMIINRQAAMAAELLQTGKVTIKGYADDGQTVIEDVIDFETNAVVNKSWDNTNADIYGDLRAASEQIQEDAGIIPTLLICGKNVEDYLLKNKFMQQFMFSANANATAFLSYQPRYSSPQVRTLGFLGALNLEMVSYLETYSEGGQVKPFINPDTAILCVPGRGKMLYGAVSLLKGTTFQTFASSMVPNYTASEESQTSALTLYSRTLPLPEDAGDFICFKVKQ